MNKKITRRAMLKAAGAVTAFEIMKPSTALGTQANSKVKAGVVGLGGRGALIARHVKKNNGFEITAVADYFDDRVKEIGKELGVPEKSSFSGLSGYKKLIESGVEAIYLETPPCFFPEHARVAVDAGCHVYVAKPVACDVPGTMSMKASGEKATKNKQVFLIDFQTRTDPVIAEGVEKVQAGMIGKIGMIDSIYADGGFRDPPKGKTIEGRLQHLIWTNDIELGGGMLVNSGVHMVDLGLWMNGDKLPLSAMGVANVVKANPNGDTAYIYSLTYEFESGVVMNHRGDHLKNRVGYATCFANCQQGYFESGYGGMNRIIGNKTGWRGADVGGIYISGIERNIATFHKSICEEKYDNPTLIPSINSNLATILGREAGRRKTKLTMDEVIKENRRLDVDLTGLKS